jgi:hypothetical protein
MKYKKESRKGLTWMGYKYPLTGTVYGMVYGMV